MLVNFVTFEGKTINHSLEGFGNNPLILKFEYV